MHENAAGRGRIAASLPFALGDPAAAIEGKRRLGIYPENAARKQKGNQRRDPQ